MSTLRSTKESGGASPELSQEVEAQQAIAYTTFNVRQRRLLTFLLGLTTIISPLTATIYFPLLPLLTHRLNTTAQAINLTITIYIIFQALSPAIFATLSDSLGRRIVYLVTLTLYVLSNLGLALTQKSYVALLILRAAQSLGASAASAISYGVVADVCVPAERGSMVGPISIALNLGTCIGPIIGGLVAYKSVNYAWIFWFLLLVGVALLATVAGFLPETARNVVGNGSREPSRWWERTWMAPLRSGIVTIWYAFLNIWTARPRSSHLTEKGGDSKTDGNAVVTKKKLKILNPLQCLKILFLKDAVPILLVHGFSYMIDFSIQTSIPSAFTDLYHLNELEIGLSYLPRGTGIIIGGYANGILMDRNYKITAKQIGHRIDRQQGDDINNFPIERARTRGSPYLIGILTCSVIGYGWALDQHSHIAIALILQFIQGVFQSSIYIFSNTLLIDILSDTPSTAAATASITRCALAALGTATVQPLIGVLGRGWYFTLLGLFTGVSSLIAIWTIRAWGRIWRNKRVAGRPLSVVPGVGPSSENRLGTDGTSTHTKDNTLITNQPGTLIRQDGQHESGRS
ncbi:MAG: hypothetical protein Q9186_000031 [Xanthomendoza sp. 1 TL-2023]